MFRSIKKDVSYCINDPLLLLLFSGFRIPLVCKRENKNLKLRNGGWEKFEYQVIMKITQLFDNEIEGTIYYKG
jgi:hypothetical protein